LVPGTLLVS